MKRVEEYEDQRLAKPLDRVTVQPRNHSRTEESNKRILIHISRIVQQKPSRIARTKMLHLMLFASFASEFVITT